MGEWKFAPLAASFCLCAALALQQLPAALAAMAAAAPPMRLTFEVPHQQPAIPFTGLANNFIGGKPSTLAMIPTGDKPEDRIKKYHLEMSQRANRPTAQSVSQAKPFLPIPKDRKGEAAILRRIEKSPVLDRIQNLGNQLKNGHVTPGELLHKQKGRGYHHQGKALTQSVVEPMKEKMKGKKKEIALVATHVALEAMEKEKPRMLKEAMKEVKKELKKHHHHHHHHGKGKKTMEGGGGGGGGKGGGISLKKKLEVAKLRKANRAQAGFMAIVTHKIIRPSVEVLKSVGRPNVAPPLTSAKEVHNLLWTAVALAREQLAVEKTKAPACLLEFLGRMVGGAFAPFVDRENEKHIGPFLHKLRNYETAFLSSGYRRFWRFQLIGGKKKFEEIEKNAKPVFINHEV